MCPVRLRATLGSLCVSSVSRTVAAGSSVRQCQASDELRRPVHRWFFHLTLNAVNDGDLVFMHRQSEWLRAAEAGDNPANGYYMPGQSDRWVAPI